MGSCLIVPSHRQQPWSSRIVIGRVDICQTHHAAIVTIGLEEVRAGAEQRRSIFEVQALFGGPRLGGSQSNCGLAGVSMVAVLPAEFLRNGEELGKRRKCGK
jgi:hypothetical protein